MTSKTRRRKLTEIVARDGADCWLCGLPVDLERRDNSGAAPSIDHVAPLREGGTHAVENLRLAHIGCNLYRDREA